MMKDEPLNYEKNNIFLYLKEMESLSLEDGNFEKNNGGERTYNEMGSLNEEAYSYARSGSNDYFRSSSLGGEGVYAHHFDDDYFNEGSNNKKKLTSKNSYLPSDFAVVSTIGCGAYSSVVKVKHKKTKSVYAAKVMDKMFMEKEKKLYQVYVENDLLNMCNHPNIIKIFGAYEDEDKFYLVVENATKGSLKQFINSHHPLNIEIIKFFLAQTLNAIEYLSSINIVHRDIKPDNIVITKGFQLKLIDFSTATLVGKVFDDEDCSFVDEKIILKEMEILKKNEEEIKKEKEKNKSEVIRSKKLENTSDSISNSSSQSDDEDEEFDEKMNSLYSKKLKEYKNRHFVGTPEYMAPEVINCKEIGVFTDLWSFGCLVYQCFTGVSPFADKTQYLVFQNILNLKYTMDKNIPKDAQELIKLLLQLDPKDRLGSGLTPENTFDKLKKHPFFNNFDSKKYIEILESYINPKEYKEKLSDGKGVTSHSEKKIQVTHHEEKILKVGELKKQSPWFHYDKRKIILYNTPRIDYIDPSTNILKGSILLNHDTYAELIDMHTFELITPNRTYTFKCKDKYDITPWVIAINDSIKTYLK